MMVAGMTGVWPAPGTQGGDYPVIEGKIHGRRSRSKQTERRSRKIDTRQFLDRNHKQQKHFRTCSGGVAAGPRCWFHDPAFQPGLSSRVGGATDVRKELI